jgi:serine O-acetyltransferase
MTTFKYSGDGIEQLIASYKKDRHPFTVQDNLIFPDVEPLILELKHTLFPRYHNQGEDLNPSRPAAVQEQLEKLTVLLVEGIKASWQISASENPEDKISEPKIDEQTHNAVGSLLDGLAAIREILKLDIEAALKGDPAANGAAEIITTYPAFTAILTYRVAHLLYHQGVPYLPRRLTEYSHSKTGIDIHPGAKIGDSFFIDHGTGVVIGETAEIGKNVRMYQGTVLGAWLLSVKNIDKLRESKRKRHPTVEDNVVIYSNASIVGGRTRIGKNSLIGGNVTLVNKKIKENSIVINHHTTKIEKLEYPEELL